MSATMEKICRTCQYTFSFPMAEATFACPACSTVNGRPQAEGAGYDHLTRATRQRLGCDFHNAVSSYQHVLLDYPDEHEALWGLTLCRYGVEYVEDPRSGTLMPTVHSVRRRPMQADKDFLNACEQAPENVRAQYEAEAAYIDDAMARIRELAQTQKPYDVFICHKTTRPDSGDPTWECLRASEMAHQLEKQGYRVFFAPEAMKGEIGADYEAAIYHALDTAKVLLLLCAEPDYVTSPWVRSEWTRFLEMTDEREDKRLVPLLYGDFTPAKLPRELRPYRLECVSMDSFTAASDVLRLLEKCCGKRGAEEKKPAPVKTAPAKPVPAKSVPAKSAPAKATSAKPAPAPAKPALAKTTPARPATAKKAAPSIETLDRVLAEMDMYPVETANKPAPTQPAVIYAPESDFETAPVKGGCSITKYRGKGGNVSVPPTIGRQKVVEIGKEAFKECSSLTSITLPEGVRWIQNGAFSQCDKLAEVTLPGSLKRIDCNAFAFCSALKSMMLPEGLTALEHAAFSHNGLVSVKLPASLKEGRGNPFNGCTQLTDIQLSPAHPCLEVRDGVLMDKTEKKLICYPAGLKADHYRIPGDVRSIGMSAFEDCVHLKDVTLPEGLRSIETSAFDDCKGLRNMNIPDSVRNIGFFAFIGCAALTNVTLPEAADVNDKAFAWCDNLKPKNIVRRPKAEAVKAAPAQPAAEKKPAPAKKSIPAQPAVIYAPESDFETAPVDGGCSITKYKGQGGHVNVPLMIGGQKVVEVGRYAFSRLSSLTSIVLPEGLTSIAEWAFNQCSSLTSIVLPESLTSIGRGAFNECSSLTSIALPEGLTSIEEFMFYKCSGLKSVMLPKSLTRISHNTFISCSSLTSITLPDGVKSIGACAFQMCSSLTSITLPESLTSIEVAAFSYCDSMTNITLPEGLTSLGDGAFDYCSSLTSIELPGSLHDIGKHVFRGCSNLPLSQKLKFTLKGLM